MGENVTITLTLNNTGELAAGIPAFTVLSDDLAAFLGDPVEGPPNGTTLNGSVPPNQSHTVEWIFTAQQAGTYELSGRVSYEVHLGYPGPAYWSGVTSTPVTITITE